MAVRIDSTASTEQGMVGTGDGIALFGNGSIFTYANQTGVTVANTTTETSLLPALTATGVMGFTVPYTSSLTVPGQKLLDGTVFEVLIKGNIGVTGTPTLRLQLKATDNFGNVRVIADTTALTLAATAGTDFEVNGFFFGVGGNSTGWLRFRNGATVLASPRIQLATISTIATSQVLSLTATWSVASASNTITNNVALIEVRA